MILNFQIFGANTCLDNLWTVKNSNLTVLGIKPYVFPRVLSEISPAVGPDNIIISVAAGVTIESIEAVSILVFISKYSRVYKQ